MNQVLLEGNVTKDVCLDESGKKANFRIAVNGGNTTNFISVRAFGELAQSCVKHLKKGTRVKFTGYISAGSFAKEGGKEGERIYYQNIVATDILIVGSAEKEVRGVKFVDDTGTVLPVGLAPVDTAVGF